jgi:hypothetical protein
MFYQGGTTFYPVAVIHICDAVYLFDFCMMYMSTYHTIEAALLAVAC